MTRKPRAAFLSHLDLNLLRFRLPIMRALLARGFEVYALCPTGGFSDRFAAEGVSHVPYSVDRASLNPFKELAVVAELTRVLRRLSPDLLHTFTMKPNIYGALAASRAGVPARVASVTGLGSFYDDSARSPARALFRRGLDALYGFALRRVDRVIFYNREDRDELLALGVCSEAQCRLIAGSGVDLSRFAPSPRPEGGPVVVTMVARLIREKGVQEFLTAAERLKAVHGERAVFQLAGEVDPGNPVAVDAARLEACAASGAIKRLGFVDDVPGLLRGSDIYALPSYYREGIPVSVVEAMSAGLAVVTTDSVGCRETIEPERSGLQVPARDADALTAALDRLIRDAELRRRLGKAARERAELVFGADKIAAAHLDVYRELLAGKGL